MLSVSDGLREVRVRIERAAGKAGRDAAAIRLIAVSKTKPVEAIREAYAAGQRDFGENYLQELADKAKALEDLREIRWHMIGHVQTNKARLAARTASYVHTVDSVRIATALGRHRELAADSGSSALPVLVELNLGGEAHKAGCAPAELETVLGAVDQQPRLKLVGLMTVPPHTEDPEGARSYFDRLRELRDRHGGTARLAELSMGMSHDLEVAIAAGASMVRVGTAIFGERPAKVQKGSA